MRVGSREIKNAFLSNETRARLHTQVVRWFGPRLPDPERIGRMTVGEPDIYIYSGHGSDLYDNEKTFSLKEVPEGCLYINLSSCGIVSRSDTPLLLPIFSDPTNKLFTNPVTNKSDIEKLLDNLDIKIYRPHPTRNFERFVNNKFFPFAIYIYKLDGTFLIRSSGLVQRRLLMLQGSVESPKDNIESISLDNLIKFFSGSVYPTQDEVRTYFTTTCPMRLEALLYDDLNTASTHFSINADVLMRIFPGIHYNFLCRNLSSETGVSRKPSAPIRRANSAEGGRSVKSILLLSYQENSFLDFFETVLEFEKRGVPITSEDLPPITTPDYYKSVPGIYDSTYKRDLVYNMALDYIAPSEWNPSYSINQPIKDQLLHDAIENNFMNSIRFFISHGAIVDHASEDIKWRIILLCMDNNDNLPLLQLLATTKTHVDFTDSYDRIPLLEAIYSRNYKIIRYLINDCHANVNIESTPFKDTPLSVSVKFGDTEIVDLLLEAGADINHRDFWGHTPLMLAVSFRNDEIARRLILAGADIHVADNEGRTPFSEVCTGSEQSPAMLELFGCAPHLPQGGARRTRKQRKSRFRLRK